MNYTDYTNLEGARIKHILKFNKNINLQPTQKLPKASKEVSVSEPKKTIRAIRVIRGQTKVSDCEPTKTIRAIRVIRGQTKMSVSEPTKQFVQFV